MSPTEPAASVIARRSVGSAPPSETGEILPESPTTRKRTILSTFVKLVSSYENIEEILAEEDLSLEPAQVENLTRLYQGLIGETQDHVPGTTVQKSTAKRKRNPWQPVLNLRRLPKPPEAVMSHVGKQGADAYAFLNSGKGVRCNLLDPENAEPLEKGEHFASVFDCTLKMEARSTVDRLRWLFHMMFFYDLILWIYPGGTGRVGRIIQAEVEKFLAELPSGKVDAHTAGLRLNEWSLQGKKIDALCQEFGPGCIFYLIDILSHDFITDKMTTKGKSWEEAKAHLRKLRIRKAADNSKLSHLGEEIRVLLRGEFSAE